MREPALGENLRIPLDHIESRQQTHCNRFPDPGAGALSPLAAETNLRGLQMAVSCFFFHETQAGRTLRR